MAVASAPRLSAWGVDQCAQVIDFFLHRTHALDVDVQLAIDAREFIGAVIQIAPEFGKCGRRAHGASLYAPRARVC